jgi:nicotinamidase-related amidase
VVVNIEIFYMVTFVNIFFYHLSSFSASDSMQFCGIHHLKFKTMSKNPTIGLSGLLRPEDSIVVLIDHQPYQFTNLNSHEPTMIINNVVGFAKSAKAFNVPTILTTVIEERGGFIIKGLQDVFPEQKPINRTFINTWEDSKVTDIVKESGRKQLILAGLFTEICVAMPAIQALADGYDVFVVTDACGGVSLEAHDMAVRRMVQAGAVPITWMAVSAEWQRDWARTETAIKLSTVILEHGGASGIALAWELQLLATPVSE